MTGRVIVVGSINTDLVVRVPRFPAVGETLAGSSFAIHGGGKGANQAVSAARFGARVRMVGAIGDDAYSHERLADLQREGIDTSGVIVRPGSGGIALIQVSDQGDNSIVIISGANAEITPDLVRSSLSDLTAGDIVCCQMEIPVAATYAALELARSRSAISLLNAAPFDATIHELMTLADVLIANEIEATQIAGEECLDDQQELAILRHLQAMGPPTVILTRGKRGACLVSGERVLFFMAPAVVPVDTTGAGDAFAGALAAVLAAGQSMGEGVRLAVQAGAFAVQREGAQPSLPTLLDIRNAGFEIGPAVGC